MACANFTWGFPWACCDQCILCDCVCGFILSLVSAELVLLEEDSTSGPEQEKKNYLISF